jgi:gluconolactonase
LENGSLITRRRFVGAAGALAGTTALAPIVVRAQAPPAGKPAEPASTISDFLVDGIKCGPDGARCDIDGNVWVSSNGNPGGRGLGYSGVTVWTPEGKLIGRIRLPEVCANIAFGGPKRNRLFMCGSQSLYALYVATQGAAPS